MTPNPTIPSRRCRCVTEQAAPKAASTTGVTVLSIIALAVAALALGVAVVGNARRKAT